MACIGYNKVWTSIAPEIRKQILAIEGPFKLDGYNVTLWASVILFTGWQVWHSFESSFPGMIVPIGFIVPEKKVKAL